jgi:hypothetical protein
MMVALRLRIRLSWIVFGDPAIWVGFSMDDVYETNLTFTILDGTRQKVEEETSKTALGATSSPYTNRGRGIWK